MVASFRKLVVGRRSLVVRQGTLSSVVGHDNREDTVSAVPLLAKFSSHSERH